MELERLQKIIAHAGFASRREAETMIREGRVTVNGRIVTELGTRADAAHDHIKVDGKLISQAEEHRYILLYKPKEVMTTVEDPQGRRTVIDLVRGIRERIYPVGRLDFHSEGLIILTNDGEFTNRVAGSKTIPKVYEVKVKGLPNRNAISKLRKGVMLEDGFKTAPADIRDLKPTDKNGWYEITLYEGHNQQIRKMFDVIGNSVIKLRRTKIGSVADPHLKPGQSRDLTQAEVSGLMHGVRPSGKGPARP